MGCEKEENKLWLLCFWGIALLRNSQENTQSGGADKLTTRNKATKWSRSEKTHRRKAIWWLQSPALQQNDLDSWDVDGREKLKEEGKIEPWIFYYFLFVSSWTHGPIFIDWSMTRPLRLRLAIFQIVIFEALSCRILTFLTQNLYSSKVSFRLPHLKEAKFETRSLIVGALRWRWLKSPSWYSLEKAPEHDRCPLASSLRLHFASHLWS